MCYRDAHALHLRDRTLNAGFAPMRSHSLLLVSLALVAACDHAPQKLAGTASLARSDSVIYGILIDSLRQRTRSVRVVRQYKDLPDPDAELARWAATQRFYLDSALIVSLPTVRHAGSVSATVSDMPGARWIDDTARVDARHVAESRIVLSRVAYSADSSRALVFAWMWCGLECGNGSYYQFQHSPVHGWQLVARVVQFVA